jgi:hypothetical protein
MSSPPTSSLDDHLREQDEIFAPSSDSPELIVGLLATKMGREVYLQMGFVTDVRAIDAICMPRESRVGGSHGLLNVPSQHQR